VRQATTASDISEVFEKTDKAIAVFHHRHSWPRASVFPDALKLASPIAQHLDFFVESLKPFFSKG
jgi:hypothetical protein